MLRNVPSANSSAEFVWNSSVVRQQLSQERYPGESEQRMFQEQHIWNPTRLRKPLESASVHCLVCFQPDVHPGQCWAFKGTQGYLVIQLAGEIYPTAFAMEHIPKALSPTGNIDSAPKDFSVSVSAGDVLPSRRRSTLFGNHHDSRKEYCFDVKSFVCRDYNTTGTLRVFYWEISRI